MNTYTFFVDADGTIVNSMPRFWRTLCRIFEHFGKASPTFSEYVLGVKHSYFAFYSERIPELESEDQLMELWWGFLSEHDSEPPEVFEGAIEFFDFALRREVELVLVSANGGSELEKALEQKKLKDKFSAIYTGVTDKAGVINGHLEMTGKSKFWSWMIGDSLLDYHAAEAAGVEFIGLLHDISDQVPQECLTAIRHEFESRHHYVVDSFEELAHQLLPA